jgi:hypothetical protein
VCARATISGNTVNGADTYGIEIASGCFNVSANGNNVKMPGNSGRCYLVADATNTTITGGDLSGAYETIYVQDSDYTTISGATFSKSVSPIYVKNSRWTSITGNTLIAYASTFDFITLNSADAPVIGVIVTGNTFQGTVTNNGFTLIVDANYIQDVLITGNMAQEMICPGLSFSESGSSFDTRLRRIRCYGNTGGGYSDFARSFNVDYWERNVNTAMPYKYYCLEKALVNVDASGGARSFQLPDALYLGGYEITIQKSDSSGNAVTVTTYNSQTINGASTFALASQWKRATFRSSGINWFIIQSN